MRLNKNTAPRWLAPLTASALGLASLTGCGGSSETTAAPGPAAEAAPSPTRCTPTVLNPSARGFLFDMMCGGDPVIMVYPDPTPEGLGTPFSGTYKDGETRPVDCHVPTGLGREVTRNINVGELPGSSSDWFQLYTPPGQTSQYATVAYGNITPGLEVPECAVPLVTTAAR
jgi:hypothetical protein